MNITLPDTNPDFLIIRTVTLNHLLDTGKLDHLSEHEREDLQELASLLKEWAQQHQKNEH